MRPFLHATLTLTLIAGIIAPADAHYYSNQRVMQSTRVPPKYSNVRSHSPNPLTFALDVLQLPIYTNDLTKLFQMTEDTFNRLMPSSMSTLSYYVSENKENRSMELTIELPGVNAKDLTVELEDNMLLRIKGSRTGMDGLASQIDRTFQLDHDIDPSSLTVTLSSGLLKITGTRKEKLVKRLSIESPEDDEVQVSLGFASRQNSNSMDETVPTTPSLETVDGLTITEDGV